MQFFNAFHLQDLSSKLFLSVTYKEQTKYDSPSSVVGLFDVERGLLEL